MVLLILGLLAVFGSGFLAGLTTGLRYHPPKHHFPLDLDAADAAHRGH